MSDLEPGTRVTVAGYAETGAVGFVTARVGDLIAVQWPWGSSIRFPEDLTPIP
jgi:hypothetical protein